MTTEHEVFSDEYMSSRAKRHKQGIALFTVLTVVFSVLGVVAGIAGMVMGGDLVGLTLNCVILSFVSIGIVASVRGRHDTLLENKRLWDRASS